jgi:thymidylate synthase (FAD)
MKCEAILRSYTQPALQTPARNAEDLIAFCARVSSDRPVEERAENYEGLLKYCLRHKHWSIFEMADATVEIIAPRDITRQCLRHRSFSFQEFSQRYSDDIEFTDREVRLQDYKNRQNSIVNEDPDFDREWADLIEGTITEVYAEHKNYVGIGVAKECARVILPEGLTLSRMYMKGSARSWLHYLDVRLDVSTQKEHRILAEKIKDQLMLVFPTILGMNSD